MEVVENVKSETIKETEEKDIFTGTRLKSDGYISYGVLKKIINMSLKRSSYPEFETGLNKAHGF